MKHIGITQRVERVANYAERRDCLDQRWYEFVEQLGGLPIPLPNIGAAQVASLLDEVRLDGVIFTGGNSLASLDSRAQDLAPERDAFESALLAEVVARSIPAIGVCRGMQLVNVELGGQLCAVEGHVAQRHELNVKNGLQLANKVNSFHHWGIAKNGLADGLIPLASDAEGNIEAFYSTTKKILGLMWHPEREMPFSTFDIELIKQHLK